jgi:hypothetical protein
MSTTNLSIRSRAGRPGLRVTSPKDGYLEIVTAFHLAKFAKSQNSPLTDLWATFEGVLVILMRWPY